MQLKKLASKYIGREQKITDKYATENEVGMQETEDEMRV